MTDNNRQQEVANEQPPGLCHASPDRIPCQSFNRLSVRFGKVAAIWGLSSPLLASRLRDDLDVLGFTR